MLVKLRISFMYKDISKYYYFLLGFLFCLILLFLRVGFSLWLWIYLLLILLFILLFYFKQSLISLRFWFYIFIFVIVIGLIFSVVLPKGGGLAKSSAPKLTKEQCVANAKLYNGKVLKLKGEGFLGKAEVFANTEKCRLEVYYVMFFNAGLAPNAIDQMTWKYNYTGLMKKDSIKDRRYYRTTGSITIVEANAGKLPESAKDFQKTSLFYRPTPTNAWNELETTNFYNTFSIYQDLTDEGYRDLFNYNWFGVVDLKPYTTKVDTGNGGFEYKTDTESAEINGNIVKEFKFSVKE